MANIKKIVAAMTIVFAALIVWSCGSEDVLTKHSGVEGIALIDVPKPEDTYLTTLATATDTFVDGRRELTVNVYDIYKTPDEEQKKVLVHSESYSWTPTLRGDDVRTGDYDGKKYSTVAEKLEASRTPLEDKNHFKRQRVTTTAPYPLVCEDGTPTYPHEFILDDEDVDFVFYSEKKGEDIVVKFGTSKQEWSEKTNRSDETNVPVDGAFWDAEKYLSTAVVKLTPASEYATGEPCELTAENVTFLLKHKVEPRLLPGGYDAEFYTNQLKLLTRKQTYKFQIAQYDNGQLVGDPVSYEKDYDLFVKFGPLSDKVVDNEADLWAKGGKFAWTNLVSSDAPDGIFTRTSYDQTGTFTLPDGQVVDIAKHWESGAWGNTKFPYAEIDKITATEDVKENPNRTTDKQKVTTVTVIFTVYPKAVGDAKKFEPETITVQGNRIYNIPDNFTTKDENAKYEFDGKVNSEKNAFTKTVNKYSWTTNTYNNGVLVPNSGVPHEINMPFEVSVTNGTQVSITKDQRGKAVKVKAVDLGTLTNSDVDTEGGNKMRTSTRNATIIMDDGARVPAKVVYGHIMQDGKDVFVYTEAKNLRVESVDMPKLDEERSSGDSEIYLVGLKLAFDCEEHGSVAATRANGDTRTEYLEAYYEQAVGDEYVPGTERTLVTVTPNGDEHKWLVEGFMTKTLSGEVRVDFKEGVYAPSLKGIDGTPIEVSNTDFEQKGSGYEGTGNGTYSQPATNGKENLTSQFLRNVGGDVVTTLDFPSGPKTVTIPATFEIRDLSPEITPTGSSNGFDTYRYTARVEGISTLGGKSITLPASANTQLKVKKSNNLVRQWNEPSMRPNGQGFDLTVVFYEEYEQDGVITKTLTDKMGRGFDPQHTDDMTVSEFANPETTSNGATGGTRGTYSSTTRVGNGSRNNVRSYWYDDVKTISYNGQSATFRGSATFDEVSSTVGSPSVQGKNNVYPLTNKAKMVYTVRCDNKSESETITNEVKWNIIVPIPDNIPDLIPGKIRSAAITCVPALGPETKDNDPLPYGAPNEYIDDDGIRHAVKCLTIVSSEGAVAIPFAMWDSNVAVPRESDIRSANFVSGSYGTDYNSGHDPKHNGVWVPAVAKDTSKGIAYYINGECVRSIRDETLNQWIWRNGNHSVFVTGYTFNVDNDGVLTVRYNGDIVLQCK